MRLITLYLAIALAPASACAQSLTPFTPGVPDGALKSASGNYIDPMGAWNESSNEPLFGSKASAAQNYSIATEDGLLVLSQMWDGSCTTSECPTQIYLVRQDSTREQKLAPMMLPQLEAPNLPLVEPNYFLNPDRNSITVLSADGAKFRIELK
jgi:hypothetical protein